MSELIARDAQGRKLGRKTAHIDIRITADLIGRINDWCDQQRVPPTRSAAVVHMIEAFLDAEEGRDA
jgi:hypothetical protein